MNAARRYFIALLPPPATRAALVRLRDAHPPGMGARAVTDDMLHLTVVFIGALSPPQAAQIAAWLATLPPLKGVLTLDQLGGFARAGVVWAGSSVPCAPLEKLAECVREGLRRQGVALAAQPFRAHVTLWRKAPSRQLSLVSPICWRLGRPRLQVSISGPAGVRYRTVKVLEKGTD